MANHKSAHKRIRQTIRRTARNRYWRSTMRTAIKQVRALVAEKKLDDAKSALHSATRIIDRVASKGVIHRRQASRRISRLTLLVNRSASGA